MDKNKIISKLEQDLSHFLISEVCKDDPSKRGTSEMYKYKGLGLSTNERSKDNNKILAVSIGPLEARFKIENGDKVSGNLSPEDERLVQMWMGQSENCTQLRSIFTTTKETKLVAIIPFDLEEYYTRN